MKYQSQFNKVLNKLYRRRVYWLHRVISGQKPGARLTFNKNEREKVITKLQDIASFALSQKLAKREFKKSVVKKKISFIKGHGIAINKEKFNEFLHRKVPKGRGKIYVFFDKHKCLYVGRTIGRGGRPKAQFKKGWFDNATRIVMYFASDKRRLPRLECLAIHHFAPSKNRMRASRGAWTRKCPLCKIHKGIRREVRQIFSLPIRLFKA